MIFAVKAIFLNSSVRTGAKLRTVSSSGPHTLYPEGEPCSETDMKTVRSLSGESCMRIGAGTERNLDYIHVYKIKNKEKYHTAAIVPNSNRKIVKNSLLKTLQ